MSRASRAMSGPHRSIWHARNIETVPRRGYRFIEHVRAGPQPRPANPRRDWRRALLLYGAVAIFAALAAILFARTRYDKFVPSQRPLASPSVPAR